MGPLLEMAREKALERLRHSAVTYSLELRSAIRWLDAADEEWAKQATAAAERWRFCPNCNVFFYAVDPRRRYCSTECKWRYQKRRQRRGS